MSPQDSGDSIIPILRCRSEMGGLWKRGQEKGKMGAYVLSEQAIQIIGNVFLCAMSASHVSEGSVGHHGVFREFCKFGIFPKIPLAKPRGME